MQTVYLLILGISALAGVLVIWEWYWPPLSVCLPNCGQNQLSVLYDNTLTHKGVFFDERERGENMLWKVFHKIAKQEKHYTSTAMNKNFGLTEAEFDQLLSELGQGNERLFEQVFLAHFEDCCKYLMHTYGASSEDAYDASMNTMLEFCKRLKAGKVAYGNLRFLFTRMAGQVYLKWIKKQKKHTGLEDMDLMEAPEELDDESYAILSKAWDGLLKECQTLLEEFYYTGATLEHIASVLNRSAVAVRKQKQRCVEKLRELFIRFSIPES